MAKMVVVLDVDVDPTRVDPWEIIDDVLSTYSVDQDHQYDKGPRVLMDSAEWVD